MLLSQLGAGGAVPHVGNMKGTPSHQGFGSLQPNLRGFLWIHRKSRAKLGYLEVIWSGFCSKQGQIWLKGTRELQQI